MSEEEYEVTVVQTDADETTETSPTSAEQSTLPVRTFQRITSQTDRALRLVRDPEKMRQAIQDNRNEPHVYLMVVLGLIMILAVVITVIQRL